MMGIHNNLTGRFSPSEYIRTLLPRPKSLQPPAKMFRRVSGKPANDTAASIYKKTMTPQRGGGSLFYTREDGGTPLACRRPAYERKLARMGG
jgi:hypothetical protein